MDKEIGHHDLQTDLSNPEDDDQVEPGAKPWTPEDEEKEEEKEDGTESRPS